MNEGEGEHGLGEVGGGLFAQPDKIVSDCNLVARYPIAPRLRTRLVRVLARIAECSSRPRERIAACRALVGMDKLNLEQEQNGTGRGVTVNIVNQAIAGSANELHELSDDDLKRIIAAGGGGVVAEKISKDAPS